ncbi:prephenate dehydratase [Arcobacter sp. YIC-464]|uniref:prephenate dehydratase n=1 Tax=Arcobacter sp. YIC-464 TaxID=3376631 RepID=UPI003C1E4598
MNKTVVYQGVEGAYSHLASSNLFPNSNFIASDSFLESMQLVEQGKADFGVIPIENSSAGRVEEIYRLIPKMQLNIIDEYFHPIEHALIAVKGYKLEDLKTVSSHPQALAQCMNNIKELNLKAISEFDTAGSAMKLEQSKDKTHAVIASTLAAKIYNLEIVKEKFSDYAGNVTRFIVLTKEKRVPKFEQNKSYITSLIFSVRNIPAALYKALGGFATNGIDLIKIESYSGIGSMYSTQFHVDLYGHTDEKRLQLALDELRFFVEELKIIGVYERHEYRDKMCELNQVIK